LWQSVLLVCDELVNGIDVDQIYREKELHNRSIEIVMNPYEFSLVRVNDDLRDLYLFPREQ